MQPVEVAASESSEVQVPGPTYGTLPGVANVSSSRVGYDCDPDHAASKGQPLDGVEGWGVEDGEVG